MRRINLISTTFLILVGLLAGPGETHAFLGFGGKKKKKDESAPAGVQRANQESAAERRLRKGQSEEAKGNKNLATDHYRKLVRDFPLTDAAATGQFRLAGLYRLDNKPTKAFEAYQKLINTYRNSPDFAQAVQHQYEIANEAFSGEKVKVLGISTKVSHTKIIEMFQAVIKNAPHSKYAPLSQFQIGKVYEEKGSAPHAVAAYQLVVDTYPDSPQAPEAQYRIGAIRLAQTEGRTYDRATLDQAQEDFETLMTKFPEHSRAGIAEEKISVLDEAQAAKSLQIGKFYQRSGKLKAAAIYYAAILENPESQFAEEARKRLNTIRRADPTIGETHDDLFAAAGNENAPNRIPAKFDVKSRPDYAGPPAPPRAELNRLLEKPQMRTSEEDVTPIPMDEPDLPLNEGVEPPTDNTPEEPPLTDDKKASDLLRPGSPPLLPPAPALPEQDPAPAPENKNS